MADITKLGELADHLSKGKLGHWYFDFGNMNAGPYIGYGSGRFERCKACGDALGELPFISTMWTFDEVTDAPVFIYLEHLMGRPTRGEEEYAPVKGAAAFFAISDKEVLHLFFPFFQKPEVYGGKELTNNASAKEVAENIYAFIEFKKQDPKIKKMQKIRDRE